MALHGISQGPDPMPSSWISGPSKQGSQLVGGAMVLQLLDVYPMPVDGSTQPSHTRALLLDEFLENNGHAVVGIAQRDFVGDGERRSGCVCHCDTAASPRQH